jgi:hypothetical protein
MLVYNVFFSLQWQMGHDFKYFCHDIEIFIQKEKNICVRKELIPVRIDRIWIGMPRMPIPIRIRQNDADATRSGSGYTALPGIQICIK